MTASRVRKAGQPFLLVHRWAVVRRRERLAVRLPGPPSHRGSDHARPLTHREKEVLGWVSTGLQNREVAHELGVSLATIRNHVHNILEKLEVHSKLEAVSLAFRRDWIAAASARPTSGHEVAVPVSKIPRPGRGFERGDRRAVLPGRKGLPLRFTGSSSLRASDRGRPLTRRETEVLERVSAGLQNKEVAQELGVSLATIRNHVHSILVKLQVRSKLEAVSLAFRRDWLAVPDAPGALE